MTIGLGRGGHGVLRLVRPGVYLYFCPRCACGHTFNLSKTDHPQGLRWGFDGDLIKPTVEPELVFPGCRHYIRAGLIHYLNGPADDKPVPMVDFPRS